MCVDKRAMSDSASEIADRLAALRAAGITFPSPLTDSHRRSTRSRSAPEAAEKKEEKLEEFFAPGVVIEDVPDLHPLRAARAALGTLTALFHGGETAVLIRLLVLREIGARADAEGWSSAEIEARFAYLDPTKLGTVLRRLGEYGVLQWDAERRLYRLSATGRMVLSALAGVLEFAAEEDAELGYLTSQVAAGNAVGRLSGDAMRHLLARLVELEADFAAALQSQSEARLRQALDRLNSVFAWVERGTDVMKTLAESDRLDTDGWKLAQEIGSRQSRILRLTGVFQRELAAYAKQRVHLSQGGITSSELAAWLRRQSAEQLAALGQDAIAAVPDPVFVAADVMLDVAEFELLERTRAAQAATTLPPAAEVAETTATALDPPPELRQLLQLIVAAQPGAQAAQLVVGGRWSAAAYRLSLLSLLGEPSADPALAELAGSPLRLHVVDAEPQPIGHDDVAAMTPAELEKPND